MEIPSGVKKKYQTFPNLNLNPAPQDALRSSAHPIVSPPLHSQVIFIAQRLPHIVQTDASSGGLVSRSILAFTGSIESLICESQSRAFLALESSMSFSTAPFLFLAMSPAWAAMREAITPSFTSSTVGSLRCSLGVT